MSLKLVPFNPGWISHDKLDLHAIYRRPRKVTNEFDEWVPERDASGAPTYDLTAGLPIRQHNRWTSKGFEYVTLATRADLEAAGRAGTIAGNWREYDQHQTGGPWNAKKYFAGQQDKGESDLAQLKADVERFGPEAVEELRRRVDPHFVLPESLKPVKRGPGRPRKDEQPVEVA